MALVLGTNCGFVSTAPDGDPGGGGANQDNTARAMKHTTGSGMTKITEIGWYHHEVSTASDYELGLYSHDAENNLPDTLLYSTNATSSGTTAGWKTQSVDWDVSENTIYWIAVQLDDVIGGSEISYTNTGGEVSIDVAITSLKDTWVSDGTTAYIIAIYALEESGLKWRKVLTEYMPNETPTFDDVLLDDRTASRLLATDGDKITTSVTDFTDWVAGTVDEIDVADDGDGTVTIGLVNPLIVGKGGTGAATLIDHSLLVGSGTDAITALGVATNGQLPIGSTGADPVLAEGTGTANQVTVANAAGSITLSLPQDIAIDSSPQFTGIELGHATDTTITRASAGIIAIEGVNVMLVGDAPTAHYHDGDTLQHDGVNSDGGAFSFTTTGAVTFNQDIHTAGNIIFDTDRGGLGYSDNSPMIVFDDTNNRVEFVGNIMLADDGTIGVADGTPSIKFDNTDGQVEITGTLVNEAGSIHSGVDGSARGAFRAYGPAGSDYGGSFYSYTSADEDGTIDYYMFSAHEDDCYVCYAGGLGSPIITVTGPACDVDISTSLDITTAGTPSVDFVKTGSGTFSFYNDGSGHLKGEDTATGAFVVSGGLVTLRHTADGANVAYILDSDFVLPLHDGGTHGLKLGATLVTSTAAELNILDGVTATAANINELVGGGETALHSHAGTGAYGDEDAQDAVGDILDDGSTGTIDFTYDDATPAISARSKYESSAEMVSNGSFTSDTTGWSTESCTIASVASGASGNCLEITRTGGTNQAAIQSVTFEESAIYRLSFYVKVGTSGGGGGGVFRVGVGQGGVDWNPNGYLQGDAAASWGSFSFTFTARATDDQVTVSKYNSTAGTMLFDEVSLVKVNESACRITLSADQSIPNTSATKVQFNQKDYDYRDEFDETTNYRFTATEAGIYHISGNINFEISSADNVACYVYVHKNGVVCAASIGHTGNNVYTLSVPFNTDIFLDGITDYIEIYVYHNQGTNRNISGASSRDYAWSQLSIHRIV